MDLNLSLELEDLTFEAQFAREKVKNIIAERQAKMKSSKYPDELVTITSHLVDFWWTYRCSRLPVWRHSVVHYDHRHSLRLGASETRRHRAMADRQGHRSRLG